VCLDKVEGVAVFYKRDYKLLKEYVSSIGTYAAPYILDRFDIAEARTAVGVPSPWISTPMA
jgi:hypothetical protein